VWTAIHWCAISLSGGGAGGLEDWYGGAAAEAAADGGPALAVWFSHIVTPWCSATSWPLGANHWPAEQQPPGWGHDDGEQGAVTM
jgi:hypothetical protein